MFMPIIQTKISKLVPKSPTERALKQQTIDRLLRPHHICKCKNAVIENFLEELKDLKDNKTKKEDEDDEEVASISLDSPPCGHQHVEDENSSKSYKKTVTFSSETKHEETAVDGEDNRNNQDQRRKKWIMHKHPLFDSHEVENTGETIDSPFGHKRGTGYKGRKVANTDNAQETRKDRKPMLSLLPSSFSEDGEVGTSKEKSDDGNTLQTSLSVPADLDKNPEMTLEKAKEDLLTTKSQQVPDQDSNLTESTTPKRKSKLEKQESLPVFEDAVENIDNMIERGPSPVQNRKLGKQHAAPDTRALQVHDDDNVVNSKPTDNQDKLFIQNVRIEKIDFPNELQTLDVNVFNDEIKETTLDEKTLAGVDLDILSSGSSPSKFGMDESDEEFLDAMSEWPKELALAMKRLNSPDVIKENDVDWESDGIDDIIPMYPCSTSSTIAKRQLDGILSYSPPQHSQSYLMEEDGDNTFRSLANTHNTVTIEHHNETLCLDLLKPSPLPNGPAAEDSPLTTRAGFRSDSSPDVLESIKPSPPVDPSLVRNKRRSVPSYVIKISGPFDDTPTDNGPDGKSPLWHRLNSGFDRAKPLVPLASEEHIGSELSIVFGNGSSLDDFSRETNV